MIITILVKKLLHKNTCLYIIGSNGLLKEVKVMLPTYDFFGNSRSNGIRYIKKAITETDKEITYPCLINFNSESGTKEYYAELSNVKNGGLIVANWDKGARIAFK